ncbi:MULTISPECIES: DUF1127 domain-containing protein [unclassified Mesorhizobium]|uniref:DUF1127 domain-containing protein n=1 Tax=unclassified Mesorhizobium TaxID=325217 RepID=UPI00333D03E5
MDNPAWRDKRLGWPRSERSPSIAHAIGADVLRFRPTPGARAFCGPKETIMLDELRYRFERWIAYRQTLASLRQVPDSTLADAGISREEIRERARRACLCR